MLTIRGTLSVQADAARHKVSLLRTPLRFALSGMLAGAYVGIAVVLMLSTAGPLTEAGSGAGKLVAGLVFGVGLTFVVFAGAELATSGMMTLTQGALMRAVRSGPAALTLACMFVANLIGSVMFGALVAASGALAANPGAMAMLESMLAAKAHEPPVELLLRGVLCNIFVCLGIWMCARVTSDGVKIALLFTALLAFVASGFEHVVANMTTYALGLFSGVEDASLGLFANNLVWVGIGNLIGGAVVVGLAYWVIGGSPRHGPDEGGDPSLSVDTGTLRTV